MDDEEGHIDDIDAEIQRRLKLRRQILASQQRKRSLTWQIYMYVDMFILLSVESITVYAFHFRELAIIEMIVGFSIAAVCVINAGRYIVRSLLVQVPPEQIDEITNKVISYNLRPRGVCQGGSDGHDALP